MGADLILGYVWTTKEKGEIDWDAAIAAVADVTVHDIESESFMSVADALGDTITTDEAFLDTAVRPQLLLDLDEIKAYWEGRSDRATDTYRFGPVLALITGGTSWGDDPSDMYGVITRVPTKVYEAAGFFA